jgi:uncharacterized protein
VRFEYDPAKEAINLQRHRVSLRLAERFDWVMGRIQPARTTKGETRWKILDFVDGTLYAAIFATRGEAVRIISVRHASRKERREYVA